MSKNDQSNVTNIKGIELTPEDPENCPGNGKQGYESICYKCDYCLICYSEYDDIKDEETIDEIEIIHSRRYKIRMNRVFRERIGGSYLPFPEEDNIYEKIRSKLVIKLKINEFFDALKKRRRRK